MAKFDSFYEALNKARKKAGLESTEELAKKAAPMKFSKKSAANFLQAEQVTVLHQKCSSMPTKIILSRLPLVNSGGEIHLKVKSAIICHFILHVRGSASPC